MTGKRDEAELALLKNLQVYVSNVGNNVPQA